MKPERTRELIGIYRDGLLGDTLPFWFPRCVDEEFGGFLTARDRDGSLLDDDKGVWQQGRATWLLGELYNNVEPRDEWLAWCRHGIDFLDKHCFDRDVHGKPVQEYWQDMKFWWPHNEAIIATLLAYLLTGDEKYARWHQMIHDWAYRNFPDSEHGEWFGYLHRDGRVSVPLKGNLWKGPFHLPRMQLVCWRMLECRRTGSMPRTGGPD